MTENTLRPTRSDGGDPSISLVVPLAKVMTPAVSISHTTSCEVWTTASHSRLTRVWSRASNPPTPSPGADRWYPPGFGASTLVLLDGSMFRRWAAAPISAYMGAIRRTAPGRAAGAGAR